MVALGDRSVRVMTIGLLVGAVLLAWGLVHLRRSTAEADVEAWRTQLRRAYLLFARADAAVMFAAVTSAVAH